MLTVGILISACKQQVDQEIATDSDLHIAQFKFSDVTEEAGIDFRHGAFRWGVSGDPVAMMGGGLCWLDYNEDGWLDLYVVNSYAVAEAGRWQAEGGLPRSALFRNDNGQFSDVSVTSGTDLQLRGNGCVAADFNLDGWTDLYLTTSRANVLLWNNGDGTFSQGGEASGADAYGWQTSAVVGDLNGDDWPDIFVAGYADVNSPVPGATMGFPNSHFGRRDLLYLNEGLDASGRTTFREAGIEAGLEESNFEYGLGASLTDFDGDGDLDLFVANDTNPNRLYENVPWPGGREADPEDLGFRFAEVGQYAQIGDTNSGMGVASADYDSDGRFDVMVTNMGEQLHSVYRNQSADEIFFENTAGTLGVGDIGVGWTGWGISWADVDLDSDRDLIVANGSIPVLDPPDDVQQIQFFTNLTSQGMPGLFQDLTNVAGFNELDPLLARGSAVADYDNDGDLDVAINSIGGRLALLANNGAHGNWLEVNLEGFHPGAVVSAQLPDGRELLCEVHAGSSYLSSEDPRCHFGMGAYDQVSELTVLWPGGSKTIKRNVAANQLIDIIKEDVTKSTDNLSSDSSPSSEDFLFQLLLKEGGAKPMAIVPSASPEILRLGEALFWDRELSGNRDVSCATCHHPLAATGDDLSLSIGVGGTGFAGARQLGEDKNLIPRNAPEIFNRGVEGWHTMFWDGRVEEIIQGELLSPAGDNLPQGLNNVVAVQAMFPVTSRDEMRGDQGDVDVFGRPNELAQIADDDLRVIWAAIMDRLLSIPAYQSLFADAYPDVPAQWLRFQQAANAIADYEMSIFTQTDSPWDRYLAGEADALSPEARRGAFLFYGDAGCGQCHNGALLTDQKFYNIGVPQLGPGKGDEAPLDFGRGRETGLAEDQFAFRTPPLRNVTLTGPWMHNGAYKTLEAAVQHHLDPVTALANYDVSQLDPVFQETFQLDSPVLDTLDPLVATPVDLTDQELGELMAFLQALASPAALNGCELVPDSVPSGLPIDNDPDQAC
jgi:cytochrome c peroxidase